MRPSHHHENRPVISRRVALAGAVACASIAMFPGAVTAQGTPFRFGLTPVFRSDDLELLGHLREFLSGKMGEPVELISRRTYQEITAMLLAGQVDAAWICGFPFVQHRQELALVATPQWRGRPLYQSYLIVARDRAVEDWRDLRGDVHAYSDPNSNSGFLVTQALLAENGQISEEFFSHSFFTYGHRNVVRAVGSGLAGSGSVDGYVWEVMRELEPALVEQTRAVRRSDWVGFPPVAAPKTLSGDERLQRLRDVLLAMGSDTDGRMILDNLRLDGFVEAPPSVFAPIAVNMEMVRNLR